MNYGLRKICGETYLVGRNDYGMYSLNDIRLGQFSADTIDGLRAMLKAAKKARK